MPSGFRTNLWTVKLQRWNGLTSGTGAGILRSFILNGPWGSAIISTLPPAKMASLWPNRPCGPYCPACASLSCGCHNKTGSAAGSGRRMPIISAYRAATRPRPARNLGHTDILTTLGSYRQITREDQRRLITGLADEV